jgi:hypothetical protein
MAEPPAEEETRSVLAEVRLNLACPNSVRAQRHGSHWLWPDSKIRGLGRMMLGGLRRASLRSHSWRMPPSRRHSTHSQRVMTTQCSRRR